MATQEELLLINVSLKWQDNSNNWYASVWGRNLLDKLKYTNANAIKFGNVFSPDEPRMIGLTLGYHF